MAIDRSTPADTLSPAELTGAVYQVCYGSGGGDDASGEVQENLRAWLQDQDVGGRTVGQLANEWLGIEQESGTPESEW